ncbi:hypothetical protein A3G50_02670 [Candidatus Jorgensenbacteria bacterium RIFCSPLOWO2_12_FULL_42_11]|uniref:Uncharacterized protein n=1 Tax=Candidatus Jorgensenbacteria bacterium RIFCSPLOWO2_12_FULL_42_11 TaxID=1798473 RepID=A0A1F6C3I8_9BACT|nr:MAG: hypothetical protein A3G50_02670 [Candidatus Jorgensenbacteria bacterium RIFCSPLOWO2_12_FULL_42_11]
MNNINKILLVSVIILLLVLVGFVYWQKVGFQGNYYAVYLETGDLYLGRLNKFSRYSLTDIYYIQRNPDNSQQPLTLQRLDQVFWQPENKIKFNPEKVVWMAKLKSGSDVMNFLTGAKTATSTVNASQQ